MRRKIFGLLIASLMMINNSVSAEEVTVDGIGMDRESALRDARRIAVEQVVGTFVDSRTLTSNYMIELDKVYLRSRGFVGKVEVISEGMTNGLYKVKAKINVDKQPSKEILEQVQAVIALNDPKIAVTVYKENSNEREEAIESAIIDRLIELNFTHVTNSKSGAEFLVLAKCKTSSTSIEFPDFMGGSYDTGLSDSKTELIAKIIRVDTGDILETFTVETKGVNFGNSKSEDEALKKMANEASAKVEEKFRKMGSKTTWNEG